MELTLEQQILLAEWGEEELKNYTEMTPIYDGGEWYATDRTTHWTRFPIELFSKCLSDWNIIKQLEQKMCDELGTDKVEYLSPLRFRTLYVASYYAERSTLITRGSGTDEKSAILNAVMKHLGNRKTEVEKS